MGPLALVDLSSRFIVYYYYSGGLIFLEHSYRIHSRDGSVHDANGTPVYVIWTAFSVYH